MRTAPYPPSLAAINRALRRRAAVLDIVPVGSPGAAPLATAHLARRTRGVVHVPHPSRATLRGLEQQAAAMIGSRHGAMAIVQTHDGWYALVDLTAAPSRGAGAFNVDEVGFNGAFAVRPSAGRGVRVAAVVGNGAHGSFTIEPVRR